MEGRMRYRRRASAKDAPKADKFSTLLIGQSIICGIVFLILILIKIFNAGFYESIETSVGSSVIGKSNLSDLNQKLGQMAKNNPYISKIFGEDGTISVFGWLNGGSKSSSSVSSSSSASSSSSGSESSASSASGSGTASGSASASGSSSASSGSSSSSSASASGQSTATGQLPGIGGSFADGIFFQYDSAGESIMKAYGLISSMETEEEDIVVPDKNAKVLPANVSLKKVEPPEKVYKPVSGGSISSKFDFRDDPFSGEFTFHTGLDIAVVQGTTVRAAMSGTVLETGSSKVGGNYVKLQHKNGFVTYYGHLKSVSVKKGAKVKANAKIALSGNTGNSTGPHLHFEIRQNGIYLNPELYIKV